MTGRERLLKFIYIAPFIHEDFFIPVKQGMNDAASLLGVSACFTGVPDADIDNLIGVIEKAIADKYDGIAIDFLHPDKFTQVVHKALEVDIPVVAFNMDAPGSGRLAGISQNFFKAGKTFAGRAAGKINKNAAVLVTMHDSGVAALDERLRGIKDGLSGLDLTIQTIVSGNTPELARDRILESLEAGITAILCTGQSDTHGAGLAVKTLSENKRPYVAGFDVCDGIRELINENIIDFTIDQQPYVQGFYPLMMLYQYRSGKIMPFDIDTGSVIVGKTGPNRK
jgi:simple sugar transport system substrate-binding protein